MKILYRLFAFLIFPVISYLLGATIFFTFYDRVEPGDPAKAPFVAVAKSCERTWPVTWRGFGYRYSCTIDVTRADRRLGTTKTVGWLKPEHIGREIAVNTTGRGREIVPEVRSDVFLGWLLTFLYALVWTYVTARVVGPALPDSRKKRRMPIRYVPPKPQE